MGIGGENILQGLLMGPIPAIMIRVIAPNQLGVAGAEGATIRIGGQAERAQCGAIIAGERLAIIALRRFGHARLKPRANGIERIMEICPAWRYRAAGGIGREGPRLTLPTAEGALRGIDLLRVHALEIIIFRVERADMIEAEPAPLRWAIGCASPLLWRRAEFAGLFTAWMRADAAIPRHTAMKARVSLWLVIIGAAP